MTTGPGMFAFFPMMIIYLGYLFSVLQAVLVVLGIMCCIKYLRSGK